MEHVYTEGYLHESARAFHSIVLILFGRFRSCVPFYCFILLFSERLGGVSKEAPRKCPGHAWGVPFCGFWGVSGAFRSIVLLFGSNRSVSKIASLSLHSIAFGSLRVNGNEAPGAFHSIVF